VVFWRNSRGVEDWLASWMKWAALLDSSENSTPPALARTPTG